MIENLDIDKAQQAMRRAYRAFSQMDTDLFWMGAFGKNRYVTTCDLLCTELGCIEGWKAFSNHLQQLLADHPDMAMEILMRFYEELGLDPEKAEWADMEQALEMK